LVNSDHFAIRKGGGIEARRRMSVLVEPEADRILWLHVFVLLVVDHSRPPCASSRRGIRGGSASVCKMLDSETAGRGESHGRVARHERYGSRRMDEPAAERGMGLAFAWALAH